MRGRLGQGAVRHPVDLTESNPAAARGAALDVTGNNFVKLYPWVAVW